MSSAVYKLSNNCHLPIVVYKLSNHPLLNAAYKLSTALYFLCQRLLNACTNKAVILIIIPEQFTVKVHPALFEKGAKNEALLFQSTVDIHFQNAHKTLFQSTIDTHFQNARKILRRLALCAFIIARQDKNDKNARRKSSQSNYSTALMCLFTDALIKDVMAYNCPPPFD